MSTVPFIGSAKTRNIVFVLVALFVVAGAAISLLVAPSEIFAGFTLGDIAYLVAAAGGSLIILGSLIAPMSVGKIPYVPIAMGFLIIALTCGHLAEKYTGAMAETLRLGMGVAIGLEFGLFLGWGMQSRAEKSP